MTDRGPWNVKGIDQRARAAAREAAREEGLSLGDYLNRLILEEAGDTDSPGQAGAAAPETARDVAVTLDQLTRRIEAAEARSTLAITGIDQSVLGLLARLERTEEKQGSVASHVDGLIDDLRSTHDALSEKVRRLEADDSDERNLEALKSLETALGKLASHVYEENARHQDEADAIRGRVETGFCDLNDRVEGMEAKVHSTLSEAAARVEKSVEQAELRAEGTAQHLSERFSLLETRVGEKIGRAEEVAGRMDQVEADVSGALGSMEQTLVRMQERLNRAETTTDTALRRLEASFESLDKRIETVARHASPEAADALRAQFEQRFDGLANELRQGVDTARAELARQIDETARTADPEEFGRLERSLLEVRERLSDTEDRQARALESVGEHVSRISNGLDERLTRVEQRNDVGGAEAVREEVIRLGEEFGSRIEMLEGRDNSSLERVGEEMGRLAERLEQRVQDSEDRSARAIEQVGEQVAGVAQRLQTRQEQTVRDIAARLDQAEKRHEARLSDVLSNVSERFEQLQEEADSRVSPVQKAIASLASRLDLIEQGRGAPSPLEDLGGAAADTFGGPPEPGFATSQDDDSEAFEPGLPEWDTGSDENYRAGSAGGGGEADGETDAFDEFDFLDDGAGETRESDIFDDAPEPETDPEPLAEPAPAAAKAERQPPAPRLVEDTDASDYIARARAAAIAAAADNGRSGAAEKSPRARQGRGRLPLYAAASVVVVAAAGAGYLTLRGKQSPAGNIQAENARQAPAGSERTNRLASLQPDTDMAEFDLDIDTPEAPGDFDDPVYTTAEEEDLFDADPIETAELEADSGELTPAPAPQASESATETVPAAPRRVRTVGFDPIPETPSLEQAAEAGDRLAQFQLGRDRLDAGDFTVGAELIRKSAGQGLAAAQYRLAKLHEKGLGVSRDLAEARKWTERAAQGGNVKAMHDFAVYLAEGEGGPQSYAGAVEWFGKASQYGVVDSQYNLGVLYDQGLGISPDPVEALFWFSVADRQGDPGAREMIAAMRDRVSLDEARNAERRAATWSAQTADPVANGDISSKAWAASSAPRVTAVQTALNALGYDAGAADGVLGPATREAIRSFQAANGMTETGTIDAPLVRALNARATGVGG